MINVASVIGVGVIVLAVGGYVYYKSKEHNNEKDETIIAQDSAIVNEEIKTDESPIIEDIDYTIINIDNSISEVEEIVFDVDNFYIVGIVIPITIESLLYFNYWLDKALPSSYKEFEVVAELKKITLSFCSDVESGKLPHDERFNNLGHTIWNIFACGPEAYKTFISAMKYMDKKELDNYRKENF